MTLLHSRTLRHMINIVHDNCLDKVYSTCMMVLDKLQASSFTTSYFKLGPGIIWLLCLDLEVGNGKIVN